MNNTEEPLQEINVSPEIQQKSSLGKSLGLIVLNIVVLSAVGLIFFWMGSQSAPEAPAAAEIMDAALTPQPIFPSPTISPTVSPTLAADPVITPTAFHSPTPLPTVEEFDLPNGLMFISLVDNGYTQIFAYHPINAGLTRLTSGAYEHRDPAISPDGTRLAYAADPDGSWDLFVLDLTTGTTTQLTADLAYDGAPTWSSDGAWLAYEKYADDNLEIFIRLVDEASTEGIRLTINSSADFDPAWSPDGRKIAYTNNSGGGYDIWIADLDIPSEDRFINLTSNPAVNQHSPDWSADGRYLAWSSKRDGFNQIFVQDLDSPGTAPILAGNGEYPVWAPQGTIILAPFKTAENDFLTGYQALTGERVLPPVSIPTMMDGLDWGTRRLPEPLPASIAAAAESPFLGVRSSEQQPMAGGASFGRQLILPLPDVEAPHSELSALVIESFYALRDRLISEVGWDVFSSLENAFVPFNDSLNPGAENSWLYTGRALAVHKTLLDAGWLLAVREDFGETTYWRVYIRAKIQDGSEGMPLKESGWDFALRFSGDQELYEKGGDIEGSIRPGYWVDLTWTASAYGWERIPADTIWRKFLPAANYNIFADKSGLSWHDAMSQVYPSEILLTPTRIPTFTPTPTRTPWPTPAGDN